MFIFTGHRTVLDKFLNYDYEESASKSSAASKGHVHRDRQTDRQRESISKNSFIALMGAEKCKTVKIDD
jgi:hypothetical protein